MYAVIRTGGKQYRVQAGDLLVVEKLAGEAGDDVTFGEVLMVGDGGKVTLGEPLVKGASVAATLIETRKGEKIKVFKKIRRQGYRRTGGHRQMESVLRILSVAGEGKTDKWDGKVDLTTKLELNARARNLGERSRPEPKVKADVAPPAPKSAKPAAKAAPKTETAPKVEAKAETPAKAGASKAKPAAEKKAAAPKAAAPKPAAKPAADKKPAAKPAAKAPAKPKK